MFEQLPASYDYVFIICLIFGRAFVRTNVGRELTIGKSYGKPFTLAPAGVHAKTLFGGRARQSR